jgi:hypothetical protein
MVRASLMVMFVLAGALPASADTFVVPQGYEHLPGNNTFLGPFATSSRTYQLLIHADQLTTLVDSGLTGLALRLPTSATATWPTAEMTYPSYEIYLGPSVAPADRSLVDLSFNAAGPQLQVRSGPLVIPADSFSFGSSPNPFGPTIQFDQPYTYAGGHLLVEFRHTGASGAIRSVDALGTSTLGYGADFSAAWVSTSSPNPGNFAVTQLMYSATGGCYANCDGSTVEPVLNVEDFTCFVNEFAQGLALPTPQQITHYANCDNSATEPVLNVEDFICFVSAFAAGCP